MYHVGKFCLPDRFGKADINTSLINILFNYENYTLEQTKIQSCRHLL